VLLCAALSMDGKDGPGSSDGEAMEGVEAYGVSAPSAIGSKASENVDVDEFGVCDEGGVVVVAIISSGDAWPSRTDCFRAWGWFDLSGRLFERESGEDIRGEASAKRGS